MRERIKTVIIGSGFGGSVAAYRLAAGEGDVCVLERGKAYAPGEFPREPWDVGRNFWDPSAGRLGLFDVWSFRGLDAVISAGLGGGSLIYANVLLRQPAEWFGTSKQPWPIGRLDLEPHYSEVEKMLGADKFPYQSASFAGVKKWAAMKEAAAALGSRAQFEMPNLAVSFRPQPMALPGLGLPLGPGAFPNYHGLPRTTCTLCGQCDLGCNSGSKNTLDHTYLSAAQALGADIRVLCEVRSIAPYDGGYVVRYVRHDLERDNGEPQDTARLPLDEIRCSRLILAAGSFGSTYLLLKNQRSFPGLGAALGTRFSGNGDFMTIMRRTREADGRPRSIRSSVGPVITSAVRVADEAEGGGVGPGHYVEDCGYPMLVNWLLETNSRALWRVSRFALRRFWADLTHSPKSGLSAGLAQLLGQGTAAESTMPLLGMGRDVPDGRMRLRRDRYLAIDWTSKTSREYFASVRGTMAQMADALHADKLQDVITWKYLHRTITVHPLGGCPMGTVPEQGVCDRFGEVFGYPNMYVADGSVMPGPVGANPSLTIAAFSDWMSTSILSKPK